MGEWLMSASDTPPPVATQTGATSDSVSQLLKRSLLAPSPEYEVQNSKYHVLRTYARCL